MASTFRLYNRICLLSAACVIAGILSVQAVQADTLGVNASIPYAAPTQAATVDDSPDGTTVQAALQIIKGSCQLQNPADAVVVWRDGTSIGSAPCNGTYSVQVMLKPGANVLKLRTVNPSSLYGPNSAPFTITLELPPEATPVTPPPSSLATAPTPAEIQAETPAEIVASTNAGAASDLTVTSVSPFSVLSSSNDVTVQVAVGGGQTPYTIMLDWGDGTTESHSVEAAGIYNYTHSYDDSGSHIVRGGVHDVLGASTQFMYAVISSSRTPSTAVQSTTATDQADRSGIAKVGHFFAEHWRPVAGASGAASVAGLGYLLGAHHTVGQAVLQSTRAVRPRGPQAAKHSLKGRRRL